MTRKVLYVAVALLGLLAPLTLCAQTYTMHESNTSENDPYVITACSGHLLDPGGTSDYPNSCDSYVIINPGTSGCKVHLSGNYETESRFQEYQPRGIQRY